MSEAADSPAAGSLIVATINLNLFTDENPAWLPGAVAALRAQADLVVVTGWRGRVVLPKRMRDRDEDEASEDRDRAEAVRRGPSLAFHDDKGAGSAKPSLPTWVKPENDFAVIVKYHDTQRAAVYHIDTRRDVTTFLLVGDKGGKDGRVERADHDAGGGWAFKLGAARFAVSRGEEGDGTKHPLHAALGGEDGPGAALFVVHPVSVRGTLGRWHRGLHAFTGFVYTSEGRGWYNPRRLTSGKYRTYAEDVSSKRYDGACVFVHEDTPCVSRPAHKVGGVEWTYAGVFRIGPYVKERRLSRLFGEYAGAVGGSARQLPQLVNRFDPKTMAGNEVKWPVWGTAAAGRATLGGEEVVAEAWERFKRGEAFDEKLVERLRELAPEYFVRAPVRVAPASAEQHPALAAAAAAVALRLEFAGVAHDPGRKTLLVGPVSEIDAARVAQDVFAGMTVVTQAMMRDAGALSNAAQRDAPYSAALRYALGKRPAVVVWSVAMDVGRDDSTRRLQTDLLNVAQTVMDLELPVYLLGFYEEGGTLARLDPAVRRRFPHSVSLVARRDAGFRAAHSALTPVLGARLEVGYGRGAVRVPDYGGSVADYGGSVADYAGSVADYAGYGAESPR